MRGKKYFNRELSWLEFNRRVLEEARDPRNPLLERVKFFFIVGSNLDEFFEVRVAAIKQLIETGNNEPFFDGLTPRECFRKIVISARRLTADHSRCWRRELLPELARRGLRILGARSLRGRDLQWAEDFFDKEVGPALTPIVIDAAHPWPLIANKTLNVVARCRLPRGRVNRFMVLQVPRFPRRLVEIPCRGRERRFVFLGGLICHFLKRVIPDVEVFGAWRFRVTRNSELYVRPEETSTLLRAVEREVRRRRRGACVRLEVERGCPGEVAVRLLKFCRLQKEDFYEVEGPLCPSDLKPLWELEERPELRDPPFIPAFSPRLPEGRNVFEEIRKGDILLHHPYESFESVVDFIQQAADDPAVIAIKQTLYRTGSDPRIPEALKKAAFQGKQVTAVVELKARFDEENNIQGARELEEAGVQVIYGHVRYKIHCKLTMAVRREKDGIRRYLHMGTGNYNPQTARLYTDLGLLTCREDFGEAAAWLFNAITAMCRYRPSDCLWVAPFDLHKRVLERIHREAEHARKGLSARILAKMNALVEPSLIDALYEASGAGVEIDLIVRGICCLRPGVKGLSERIRVRSIVGRFLEHSRVFYFENAARPEILIGSADWMPRNLFYRVETVFLILDGRLQERIREEIFELPLRDNLKARVLRPNGLYERVRPAPGEEEVNSQEELIQRADRRANLTLSG